MSNTFNTRIQCKKDTESKWEENNPVLLDGEIAVIVSNDGKIKFKVGDGTNQYSALDFANEYIPASNEKAVITLLAANWDAEALTNTVNNEMITAEADIIVSPAPEFLDAYGNAGVRAITQAEGSITFQCKTVPTEDLNVQLLFLK